MKAKLLILALMTISIQAKAGLSDLLNLACKKEKEAQKEEFFGKSCYEKLEMDKLTFYKTLDLVKKATRSYQAKRIMKYHFKTLEEVRESGLAIEKQTELEEVLVEDTREKLNHFIRSSRYNRTVCNPVKIGRKVIHRRANKEKDGTCEAVGSLDSLPQSYEESLSHVPFKAGRRPMFLKPSEYIRSRVVFEDRFPYIEICRTSMFTHNYNENQYQDLFFKVTQSKVCSKFSAKDFVEKRKAIKIDVEIAGMYDKAAVSQIVSTCSKSLENFHFYDDYKAYAEENPVCVTNKSIAKVADEPRDQSAEQSYPTTGRSQSPHIVLGR